MLIGVQVDMEGGFDVRSPALDVQQNPVAVRGGDFQTMFLGEINGRLISLGRGAKLFRELLPGQILPVIGAGRIIDLGQKIAEGRRVAQRQSQHQMQTIGARQTAGGLQIQTGDGLGNMAVQNHRLFLGVGNLRCKPDAGTRHHRRD